MWVGVYFNLVICLVKIKLGEHHCPRHVVDQLIQHWCQVALALDCMVRLVHVHTHTSFAVILWHCYDGRYPWRWPSGRFYDSFCLKLVELLSNLEV